MQANIFQPRHPLRRVRIEPRWRGRIRHPVHPRVREDGLESDAPVGILAQHPLQQRGELGRDRLPDIQLLSLDLLEELLQRPVVKRQAAERPAVEGARRCPGVCRPPGVRHAVPPDALWGVERVGPHRVGKAFLFLFLFVLLLRSRSRACVVSRSNRVLRGSPSTGGCDEPGAPEVGYSNGSVLEEQEVVRLFFMSRHAYNKRGRGRERGGGGMRNRRVAPHFATPCAEAGVVLPLACVLVVLLQHRGRSVLGKHARTRAENHVDLGTPGSQYIV